MKVIFVNGCFWHGHFCKRGRRVPVRNRAYWVAKIARNKQRDKKSKRALRTAGWRFLVVWECHLRSADVVRLRIGRFLSKGGAPS